MQDGMVSTVRRIDEGKGRYGAHLVVGGGNRSRIGREGAIDRRAYWRGEIPVYRISKMPRFDLGQIQRIFLTKGLRGSVRPRAARPPAIAGGAPRKKAPAR